jgi:secreted trypsin-like serine protease
VLTRVSGFQNWISDHTGEVSAGAAHEKLAPTQMAKLTEKRGRRKEYGKKTNVKGRRK